MSYSVSNDEIKKIADELGLGISFDSEEPGVLNTTTGENTPLREYFNEYFETEKYEQEIKIEQLSHIKAKKIQPMVINISPKEFSFSATVDNDLSKIA